MTGISALVAIPLIVMSYHVFQFFESDPLIVRIGLALSFDILIVVLFMLINDDLIRKNARAILTCWICIGVLIVFQLYVNIWVYWQEVGMVRAIISGAIFPLLVAPISYLASLRKVEEQKEEEREERRAAREAEKQEKAMRRSDRRNEAVLTQRPAEAKQAAAVPAAGWKGRTVPREIVEAADDIETFRGARNWRSVKRWHSEK